MGEDGGQLQRVSLCMSMSAQSRSVAHAMDCQSSTMPQGIPGEAVEGQLGASAVQARIAHRILFLESLKPHSLRKNGFLDLLRSRPQGFVAFKEANAGVPAQDRIVVAGRPLAFRFLE